MKQVSDIVIVMLETIRDIERSDIATEILHRRRPEISLFEECVNIKPMIIR